MHVPQKYLYSSYRRARGLFSTAFNSFAQWQRRRDSTLSSLSSNIQTTMDNPWSEATTTTNGTSNEVPILSEAQRQRQRQEEMTCWRSILTLVAKAWHIVDAILGISLTIYGITILPSHLHVPIFLTIGLGMLLVLRAFMGMYSLNHDVLERWGLRASAYYLSPVLGILSLIFSFLCMGKHAVLVQYLQNHASQLHLSNGVILFLQQHHHAIWVIFLSTACMEAIRWYTLPILQVWLVQLDTSFGSPDVQVLYTPGGSAQKPWWWHGPHHGNRHSSSDGLQDALLQNDIEDPQQQQQQQQPHWVHDNHSRSYSLHDAVTSPNKQSHSSFWSRWFPRNDASDDDDSQVDFLSVQEEWASKSQEDPFWWSREDDQEQSGMSRTNNNANNTATDERNVSWATQDDNER